MKKNLVLGITGASGAVYAARLLEVLVAAGWNVHLSISPSGQSVLKQELNLDVDLNHFDPKFLVPGDTQLAEDSGLQKVRALAGISSESSNVLAAGMLAESGTAAGQVFYHHYQDFQAPIASGSYLTAGMVVCPCSGTTASAIAHGTADNLIHRAADVHLKERRRLILVPRETPLSTVQLDNLKRCSEAGAVVLPAMPGFYHGARTIRDLVDFVVARICDQLGIEHSLVRRWGE
jgi:4-hydroxy-3-polyprenylbenzoate decarboxylase